MKFPATSNQQLATFLLFALLCVPLPAHSSAMEDKSQQELDDTLAKIKESEAKASAIKARSGKLERELSGTQKDAAYIAARVQQQERILSGHEEKIATLEAQRKEK